MRSLISVLVVASALVACDEQKPAAPAEAPKAVEATKAAEPAKVGPDAATLLDRVKPLYKPLPEYMNAEGAEKPAAAVIDLGRALYYDTRLSKNHDISCNSCHDLAKFGVDNEPTSPGHKGVRGGRNSPTSVNAALHIAQFWDGRAKDVEAQAGGPVLNPVEMAMADEASVLKVLQSIPGYVDQFKAAFPGDADPITYANMTTAIGAFERGLVSPAPFDAFLKGDTAALNAEQLEGLASFLDTGCMACHAGVAVGGQGYFKLGQVVPYTTADKGRMEVTGNEADMHVFKAPSLRNITKTGPYFHDGSIATLDEAVKLMAKHQLGKDLADADVKKIVTFLGSLEGTLDAAYIQKPELPASGPNTPAADPS